MLELLDPIIEQCARDQNAVLAAAFEQCKNELRHALREAAHEMLCPCCGGPAPIAPDGPPEPSDPRELRTMRVIEAARHYLSLGITEPNGTNHELIDRFIRREVTVTKNGITYPGSDVGSEWTTADAKTWELDAPYVKNGQYSWCGTFAGTCHGAAGMLKTHRYSTMPSCSRMSGDWGGTDVEINRSVIEPGDIVTVGKASDGADHKGTHVVLCIERYDDHIVTIEGNASYGGREGVITRTRPYAGSGSTYIIKKAYRPLDSMYGPLRPEGDWKW
tara:strand:+ start:520 stop:1344 length:825 start_codon:yes stop_codon:yes gene_type:complete